MTPEIMLFDEPTSALDPEMINEVLDTMGAGDSYFATFLCTLLKASKTGALLEGTEAENAALLQQAMAAGAAFAAKVCAMEGAFGYGTPILGKTEV